MNDNPATTRDGKKAMDNSNGYIKIELQDTVCLSEPEGSIYDTFGDALKGFFSLFPNRMVFIQNKQEQITGAISAPAFIRGLAEEGYCPIIRNFHHIACHKNYIDEVMKFFQEKPWGWVPVLADDGRLIEYFVREENLNKYLNYLRAEQTIAVMDMLNQYGGAWTNTTGDYLARLVQSKQYRVIKVCITDPLSEQIYRYLKHYEAYFDKLEETRWYDLSKTDKGEALILTSQRPFLFDIKADKLYFYALQAELEYHLLLHTCKQNNVRIYFVTSPHLDNVWNSTEDERCGRDQISYLERHDDLLYEVFSYMDDVDEFADACLSWPPLIIKDGMCYHRDHRNKYFNVVNGERVTHGIPASVKNRIYLAGFSFVFGPMVDDAHTIASVLQSRINQLPEYKNYEVVNQGICGVVVKENLKRLNRERLKPGDIIVLFMSFANEQNHGCPYLPRNMKIHHMEDAFSSLDRRKTGAYFVDSPVHPNAFGYEVAADYVLNMLQEDYDDSWKERLVFETMDMPPAEAYPDERNDELETYLQGLRDLRREGKIGAIVMNCNPLTYGHKHLIEYAAGLVDHLFIFVVQEDKSAFPFVERFEMVRTCAAEYPNITVIPSGKYVLSMVTFPEYFTAKATQAAENFKTAVDTSLDMSIFGKYIAPALNITVRFVGEEPLDYVTAQYNQGMKRILPKYGVDIVEIPRYQKDGEIVSATKVRSALAAGDRERVRALVPESTWRILENRSVL